MLVKLDLLTPPGETLINITDKIRDGIKQSKIKKGICLVFVPHSTAGVTINSAMDPSTAEDILNIVEQLVPRRLDYKHQFDTPADAAAHIKSSLIGASVSLIISYGDLLLGRSQSVLFCEFDGPRPRNVYLQIIPDSQKV